MDRAISSWHELTFRMMTGKDLPKPVDGLRSILTDKTSWGALSDMKYPHVICRAILTIWIVAPLLFSYAEAEELDQATTNTALEKYEMWKMEVGARTAVVVGGQTVTLAWSKLSPEQWKAMGPDGTDLIPE